MSFAKDLQATEAEPEGPKLSASREPAGIGASATRIAGHLRSA